MVENAPRTSFWSKYENIILDKNSSIEPSFKEFRDKIHADFCTKDDSKRWECCDQANHPSCSTIPSNAKAIQTMMEDPEIDISLTFAYLWCTKAWKYFKRVNETAQQLLLNDIIQGCPDPCFGNPCRTVKGVKDNLCTITGTFENDYKCNCLDDMLWDENLLICQPVNPCDSKVYKACIPENTLQCIAFDISTYQCICKSEYMGVDCSLPRDACFERVDKSQPNGDTNCQIQLGNICQPILGTDYYTCKCLAGYQPLLHISEPNCLGRNDPCLTIQLTDLLTQTAVSNDSEVIKQLDQNENKHLNPDIVIQWGLTCLNGGQCVASADFTRASCVCPTAADGSLLYTGLNCEYPVGIWSTWTLPSPCFPEDCGVTRYRWRRRYCLNGTTSEDLLAHITESSPSSTELNGWTYSHRRMPLACPGTSEEVSYLLARVFFEKKVKCIQASF
ncbi:unnamed protein product [Trichobilharzia szidati]|nr:unnamed protein product [Trichobilharzia szidati]